MTKSIHHTNIRLEPQREGEVNNYYKSFPFLVASPDKEREAWDGYGLSLSPLGFGGRLVRVRNEVTLAEDVYHCQSASRPNFMDFRVACGTSSSARRERDKGIYIRCRLPSIPPTATNGSAVTAVL